MPYRELGARIHHLRQATGLLQRDVAMRAGVHPAQMSAIERGRERCSPERLRRLAAVLGADYDELARLAGYRA